MFNSKFIKLSELFAIIKMMNKNKKIKMIILVCIISISILTAAYFFIINQNHDSLSSENPQTESSSLNLSPPTEEEQRQASENKEKLINNDESVSGNSSSSSEVVITSADQYDNNVEVSAYIPSIFEDGGECNALFTKGQEKISKKVAAVKEGRSVFCPLFKIPVDEFSSKGEWTVKIDYKSPITQTTSSPRSIDVR